MHVHWKSLLGFGLIFWSLLCFNEFIGGFKAYRQQLNDLGETYDSSFVERLLEQKLRSQISNIEYRGIKFGWTLLLWNSVAFIFSIAFCSLARATTWILWKLYSCYRKKRFLLAVKSVGNLTERSNTIISKIPVMIKSNSTIVRASDTNIKAKSQIISDISCPNLLALKRTSSNQSQSNVATNNCKTLFKNNKIFTQNDLAFDRHMENQCTKLREEMLKLQANSLKEHAVLSRKLDAVTREKRELSKQLAMAQKENRAAKQQLEELLQEKVILIKRLENATKEFKCNTKTKKFALAKLEEVTSNADNLKQQLEQVSRDKEILENKLRMLECEYEKLQERVILNQNRDSFGNYQENTPERDLNGKENVRSVEAHQHLSVHQYGDVEYNSNRKNTPHLLSSVSQTEIDMNMIQIKIKQLEKNLENFNGTKSELNFRDADKEESEISLSLPGNNTDSQLRTDDETDASENPFLYSPRVKYWGGRAGDLLGRKDQFAKIQALANKMHEKVRFLENIKECESVQDETELDEYSSHESLEDVRNPERIVSSSIAFQNFLKSLHSSESMKRQFGQFGSHSDLLF